MCNYDFEKPRPASYYEDQICSIASLFSFSEDSAADFPIDDSGCCVFHSSNQDFRSRHDSAAYLKKLLGVLEAYAKSAEPNTKILLSELKVDAPTDAELLLEGYDLSNLEIYFNDSTFACPINLVTTNFDMISFAGCTFGSTFEMSDCYIVQGNFHRSVFKGLVTIESCVFSDFVDFSYANFYSGCSFSEFHFQSAVVFCYATFLKNDFSPIAKWQGNFSGFVDFSHTVFEIFAILDYCRFDAEVNCTNAVFRSRLFIKKAIISANFILKGNAENEPVFQDLVDIDLNPEDVTGKLILENINFLKINHEHKKVIFNLEKENKADIGKGCIKYRLRTRLKKIRLDQDKQSIIIEFSQSFISYFIRSNGNPLGLEIVDRNKDYLTYFLFSDETISEKDFYTLLEKEERNYFKLIMPFAFPSSNNLVDSTKRTLMKVDGLASLFSSFMKIGIRISIGDWTTRDTYFLMNAINNRNYEEGQIEANHAFLKENFNAESIAQKVFIKKYVNTTINNPQFFGSSVQIADEINNRNSKEEL